MSQSDLFWSVLSLLQSPFPQMAPELTRPQIPYRRNSLLSEESLEAQVDNTVPSPLGLPSVHLRTRWWVGEMPQRVTVLAG